MPYSDQEKLDFLLGQIRALSAVVQVLVASRADAEQMLKETNSLLQNLSDRSVFESLSDAYGDGITDLQSKLAQTVAIFQANRK